MYAAFKPPKTLRGLNVAQKIIIYALEMADMVLAETLKNE